MKYIKLFDEFSQDQTPSKLKEAIAKFYEILISEGFVLDVDHLTFQQLCDACADSQAIHVTDTAFNEFEKDDIAGLRGYINDNIGNWIATELAYSIMFDGTQDADVRIADIKPEDNTGFYDMFKDAFDDIAGMYIVDPRLKAAIEVGWKHNMDMPDFVDLVSKEINNSSIKGSFSDDTKATNPREVKLRKNPYKKIDLSDRTISN